MKDIRRLVDNGEFLANKHSSSPVVKLITTLLLELITDHSRELVSATKQMCGLRGATKTDFASSVSLFTQQITYISKLVSRTNDALSAMAVSSHLLEKTSPESLQNGRLTVSRKQDLIPTCLNAISISSFSLSRTSRDQVVYQAC